MPDEVGRERRPDAAHVAEAEPRPVAPALVADDPDLPACVERHLGLRPAAVRLHTDTSNFFAIERGDALLLAGRAYVITGTARERGFGLDDEPKHWVKRAVDAQTGAPKIIKLVFYEQFTQTVADCTVRCFRSPAKEARVLELVRRHPHFMKGFAVRDAAGNDVRVIDLIGGPTLDDLIAAGRGPHESYFYEKTPDLLRRLLPCLDGLRFLHDRRERHGDVRPDHLIVDRETGLFRWIDFDYDFVHREAPFSLDLLGVGKIVASIVGRGTVDAHRVERDPSLAGVLGRLSSDDLSIVDDACVMNLRKVFPYVPETLNRVLLHFSDGAEVFYESVGELLDDLGEAVTRLAVEGPKEAGS